MRTATDLALCATKATEQAIVKAMANLVVLECHLWLNLTEIRDADRVTFLNSPISPKELFGPAVDVFVKQITATQKSLQAMCHFLLKRSK